MKRGDFVTVAMQGSFGKPRPALVIQSDLLQDHPTVTVLAVTGEITPNQSIRIDIAPTAENGLHKPSQIQADKIFTIYRDKFGDVFGRADRNTMLRVDLALAVFLGLS